MQDFYSVLGVPRSADQAAIQKAFKSLARKYHPDMNKESGAEARFKEIAGAYEVLGDEQRRANYDEFGEESLRAGFNADQARTFKNMRGNFGGGGNPFNGGGGGNPFGGGGGGNPFGGGVRFEDLFGDLGGMSGGGHTENRRSGKGADIESRLALPFMVAVQGGEVPVRVRRPASCTICHGEGGTGKKVCTPCGGRGRKQTQSFGRIMVSPCEVCAGTGHAWASECQGCSGTGRVQIDDSFTVRMPAGAEPGKVLRLKGRGGAGQHGGAAGDLILTIDVEAHPLLRRDGRDLELDLPVTLTELLEGGGVEVPTPLGNVRLKIPPGSANGARLRIPGRGVQHKEGAGDLYVRLRPVLPPVSEEVVALAKQLDALGPANVREGFTL